MDIVTKVFLCNLILIGFCAYVDIKARVTENSSESIRNITNAWAFLTALSVIAYIPYFFFVVI